MTHGWRVDSKPASTSTATELSQFATAVPRPSGDQIVVAASAAWIDDQGRYSDVPDGAAGRSAVGTVVAAGPSAEDLVGQRVLIPMAAPCGECDTCRRGAAVVCPTGTWLGVDTSGTAAAQFIARGRWAVVLAGDLDLPDEGGALAGGPALDAYGMYARTGIGPKEPAVVVGDTVTARLLVEVLIAKGAPPVVATMNAGFAAWVAERGGRAVEGGPDTMNAAALADAVAQLSPGSRPRRVFCAATELTARAIAVRAVTPGGSLTLLGGATTPSLDLSALSDHEVTIIGVAAGHPDLLSEVGALAVRGDLDLRGATSCAAPADGRVSFAGARPPSAAPTGLVLRLP